MHDCKILHTDALTLLSELPNASVQTLVTSPPYGIGKAYERRTSPTAWAEWLQPIMREASRVVAQHMFWQTGNHVQDGVVTPLDMLVWAMLQGSEWKLRNRIVWTYGHGLHTKRRFSGRHETVLWFTRGDDYRFDLDAVRVPQKYPNKRHFKGEKKGELSGHPLGKNPGDVWDITNVKNNHPEKTAHPCQFPEALVQRAVLCSTRRGDTVLDPFVGSGTTAAVAAREGRRFIGCDTDPTYVAIARERVVKRSTTP